MPMHGPEEVNYISIAIRNMQRFESNKLTVSQPFLGNLQP